MCNMNQLPPENAPPPVIPFPDNLGKPLQLQISLGLLAMALLLDLNSASERSSIIHTGQILLGIAGFFFLYEWWQPEHIPRDPVTPTPLDQLVEQCKCHLIEDNADTSSKEKRMPCGARSCSSASLNTALSGATTTATALSINSQSSSGKNTKGSNKEIRFELSSDNELPKRTDSEIQRFRNQRNQFEEEVFQCLLDSQKKKAITKTDLHTEPTQSDKSSAEKSDPKKE